MFQVTCKRLTDRRCYTSSGHAPLMRRVQARRASFHSHSHTHTHTHVNCHRPCPFLRLSATYHRDTLVPTFYSSPEQHDNDIYCTRYQPRQNKKRKEKNTSHHLVRELISVGDFHISRIQKTTDYQLKISTVNRSYSNVISMF